MRQQITSRQAVDRLKNHFIGKQIPGVGTWGEIDALRGWKDDFLGDVIADQYTAVSNGAGSGGALLNNAPGGFYQLTAGAGVGFFHQLWLGDAADGFATLDADEGWVMMARFSLSHTTTIAGEFGVRDLAYNNTIDAGLNVGFLANNWIIKTRTGGGAINTVDTGVVADVSLHWHVLDVYPITGGLRQVDYFLDGARIATTTISVPIAVLTPYVQSYATAAAVRRVYLDFWAVIPRNLA